jgi:protein required for attachment to host cells
MIQHHDWYVIANASRARILERGSAPEPWVDIATLVHPASRQPGQRLSHDRPGHVAGTGHGLGNSTYVPRTDPRQFEHERFAREIAETVDAAVAAGRCSGVVLVASNPFLGVLKAQLGTTARKLVRQTITHDFTTLSQSALYARLAEAVK